MPTGTPSAGLLRRAFRIVSPSCEEMTELVSAMMDRELPWSTRLRMRVHFSYCVYCRRMREQFALIRRFSSAFDVMAEDAANEPLTAADKEKLRSLLTRES